MIGPQRLEREYRKYDYSRLKKITYRERIYMPLMRLAKKYFDDFAGGLIKGFGVAIGFTLLGAIFIYILQLILQWNLPYIGEVIGKVVKLAEYYSNGKMELK